jgi:hypothetical protein
MSLKELRYAFIEIQSKLDTLSIEKERLEGLVLFLNLECRDIEEKLIEKELEENPNNIDKIYELCMEHLKDDYIYKFNFIGRILGEPQLNIYPLDPDYKKPPLLTIRWTPLKEAEFNMVKDDQEEKKVSYNEVVDEIMNLNKIEK